MEEFDEPHFLKERWGFCFKRILRVGRIREGSMKKRKRTGHYPSGKAYYNGTLDSIEWIMEQYKERSAETRLLEKYSYLPRESFHALLFVLGRLR